MRNALAFLFLPSGPDTADARDPRGVVYLGNSRRNRRPLSRSQIRAKYMILNTVVSKLSKLFDMPLTDYQNSHGNSGTVNLWADDWIIEINAVLLSWRG